MSPKNYEFLVKELELLKNKIKTDEEKKAKEAFAGVSETVTEGVSEKVTEKVSEGVKMLPWVLGGGFGASMLSSKEAHAK